MYSHLRTLVVLIIVARDDSDRDGGGGRCWMTDYVWRIGRHLETISFKALITDE